MSADARQVQQWSPVGRSARDLITYLSNARGDYGVNWPITDVEGVVSIGGEANGVTLAQLLQGSDSKAEGIAAAKRITDYVDELNSTTATIAHTTLRTSKPVLMMGNPTERSLEDRLGWHLLKARLEASGAQVIVPNDTKPSGFETWPRDRYVLGPDGTQFYHRLLTEDDSGRFGWDIRHPRPDSMDEATYNRLYPDRTHRAGDLANATRNLQQFALTQHVPVRTLNGFVEGGDVLQYRLSNTVFIGVDQAADGGQDEIRVQDAKELANALHMKLVLVPKVKNPPFYHLDTFMALLPDGSAILLPDATDEKTRKHLHAIISKEKLLEVSGAPLPEGRRPFDDPRVLGTNIIIVNGNVFTGRVLPEITAFMEARGLRVMPGDFAYDYSGPHCQVNLFKPLAAPDGRTDIALLGHLPSPVFTHAIQPSTSHSKA